VDPNHQAVEPMPLKRRRLKMGLLILAALVLASGGVAWYVMAGKKAPIMLRTAAVTRGELLEAISATGTVEPEEVVDVGAQVAGQIMGFGRDADGKPVDYGSPVKKGTILARIDDEVYTADEARARAQLQASQAGLSKAQADLAALKAKLRQAERDWQRARKLGPSEALSQASYDAYQSAFESAQANLQVGEAVVLQARAAVAQDEALLAKAKRSLGYCTITSPVEGVIIDRRVNIGQTVVASLNAPSLFLIAKDLRRMQVWVAVNEADIGKIRPGQPVSFTVDAFPGETFRGQVGKVRLNASMTQNVVTYTVEIITDNASGRLLPYLSANVQFEVRRLKDALLVPNAALRWRPSAGMAIVAPVRKPQAAQGKEATGAKTAAPQTGVTSRGLVWIPEGQKVKPVRVAVLANDGSFTAVRSKVLTADMQVVVGLEEAKARRNDESSNPFAPKFPGRSSKRQR
jgi:HlyD family secretion protein